MKQVVFLVGSYHPDFSAVGYCAYQVQKCLIHEFKISTIALRIKEDQPVKDMVDSITIHNIQTKGMRRRLSVERNMAFPARFWHLTLRIYGAIRRVISWETIDKPLVQAYLDQLNALTKPPDIIVPVVFPIETALAAAAYKKCKQNVKLLPYLFDDFTDSGSLHGLNIARVIKRKRHLKLESRILESADNVFAMHPLQKHFQANFTSDLVKKITYVEHPLLIEPAKNKSLPSTPVVLSFTGSLIKNVREPDYLLRLLQKICTLYPIQVEFYVQGNQAEKIRTLTYENNMRIINHGRVPKSQADAALLSSHILINLGDKQGVQISSKIFEYMSTGKPIIHFAYVDNDAASKILAKYPLALCIVQTEDRFVDNSIKIADFINTNKNNRISFDEVKFLYPEALPAATAYIIKNLI